MRLSAEEWPGPLLQHPALDFTNSVGIKWWTLVFIKPSSEVRALPINDRSWHHLLMGICLLLCRKEFQNPHQKGRHPKTHTKIYVCCSLICDNKRRSNLYIYQQRIIKHYVPIEWRFQRRCSQYVVRRKKDTKI